MSQRSTERGFDTVITLPAKGREGNPWKKKFDGAEEQYKISVRPE